MISGLVGTGRGRAKSSTANQFRISGDSVTGRLGLPVVGLSQSMSSEPCLLINLIRAVLTQC